jgi:outer membrane protein OmpA-like peptidoglycan-associated protein
MGLGIVYKVKAGQNRYSEPIKPIVPAAPRQSQTSLVNQNREEIFEEEDLSAILAKREEMLAKVTEKVTLGATTFILGKAALTAQSKQTIKEAISKLPQNYSKIVIEGHTDITGNNDSNDRLSKARAESVYKEFIAAGIPQEKIEFIGYGSKIPIAPNETPEGRQANRRTEIFVLGE